MHTLLAVGFDQYQDQFNVGTQILKGIAAFIGFFITAWFYLRYLRGERHFDLRGEVLIITRKGKKLCPLTQGISEDPLARAFHPWMERAIRKAARKMVGKGGRFLTLKTPILSKAMLVTLKGMFLSRFGQSGLIAAFTEPNGDYKVVKAYLAVRQDDWPLDKDRFQTVRFMVFFEWQVEKVIQDPNWLMTNAEMADFAGDSKPVEWAIAYQDDKANHLRWIAEAVEEARVQHRAKGLSDNHPLALEHLGVTEVTLVMSDLASLSTVIG